jgi:hypothetical protein
MWWALEIYEQKAYEYETRKLIEKLESYRGKDYVREKWIEDFMRKK